MRGDVNTLAVETIGDWHLCGISYKQEQSGPVSANLSSNIASATIARPLGGNVHSCTKLFTMLNTRFFIYISHKSPCKRTQQVTTLLGSTMLGVVGTCWHLLALVAWCMQTNTTPANIVDARSLFWP